jgi:hypothetical protein
MTTAARLVLADCEDALKELIDCAVDFKADVGQVRRRRLMATVALLRAVGHVLKKIDAASSLTLKSVINREWQNLNATKPEPPYFLGLH